MKSTGIVRKVDELGRIVLPVELRRNLNINKRDPLEIYIDGSRIILEKFEVSCIFCERTEEEEEIVEYKDKKVCRRCLENLTAEKNEDEDENRVESVS